MESIKGMPFSLSCLLKASKAKVKNALDSKKDYKEIKIRKRKGGYRTIHIPPKPLMEIQKKILNEVLKKIWSKHDYEFYGIQKRTSYIEHAIRHQEARAVFQLDLKNAFSSIDILVLKKILFKEFLSVAKIFLLYQENTSQLYLPFEGQSVKEAAQKSTDLILDLTTFRNILPQGAPTSPFLFYITLRESNLIGKLLSHIRSIVSADKYRFELSVYIDNFVLSAKKPIPIKLQENMIEIIERHGFPVNQRKTRYQETRHGAPLICGLRILNKDNKRKIGLSKRKIREWRGKIHRAIYEPELRKKIEGFIASLRPIYGIYSGQLPSQIEKPYALLKQTIEGE